MAPVISEYRGETTPFQSVRGPDDCETMPDRVLRTESARTCDRCGRPIDDSQWHPVAFDDARCAIRSFCSRACKRRFRADD